MSASLLQRVSAHIITDGGLLTDYTLRYYRWTDTDLQGSGKVALFRMSGAVGQVNRHIQFPSVELTLLADPDGVTEADADMLAVLRYLRTNPTTTGVFNFFPVGTYTGPTYLENDRALFIMEISTGVDDH